jgi:uncharacterized protein with PIN domain
MMLLWKSVRNVKMSEKKLSDILREELQKANDRITALEKNLLTTSTHEAMPESAKGHKTIDEVADCPNCKPKLIEKLKPEILKAERERIKGLKRPERCDDCGEVYEREERDTCPTCGKAH